jgi:hypothetical protein
VLNEAKEKCKIVFLILYSIKHKQVCSSLTTRDFFCGEFPSPADKKRRVGRLANPTNGFLRMFFKKFTISQEKES